MTLQKVIHEGNVSEYQSTDCEPLSITSKSEDIWYQNTSGGALVVMVTFSSTNNRPKASIHVNSTESDRIIMLARDENNFSTVNVTFMVPNGHYYKVKNETDTDNDSFYITEWVETSLI